MSLNKKSSLKLICWISEPKSMMSKKALRILICASICFCLVTNILFSAQYFYYYFKFQREITFAVNWVKAKKTLKIPYIVLEWIKNISQIFFVTGVPLAFFTNYFVTGRWRDLKNSIEDIRKEIVFSSTFYRRCGIGCFTLTVLSITELVLFSLLNSSEKSYFSIRKSENYRTTYNPQFLLHLARIETNNSREFDENTAIGIGTSIQSSLIAVLTLFSIVTWVASLVAEELSIKMGKEFEENHVAPNKVDQWLRQFHLFHCLVERINRCFGFLLFITLSNICILSTYYWFFIVRRLFNQFSNSQLVFTAFGRPLILVYFRLTILVLVSQRLQEKGYELRRSFRCIQSPYANIERQLQLETVALQVSVQNHIKITICDLFDLDFSYVPIIVGTTLTYSIVLYITTIGIYEQTIKSRVKYNLPLSLTYDMSPFELEDIQEYFRDLLL